MFNFEITIGIEVHTALNTKTKMFSSAANNILSAPNTNLHINDLGLPGTLPQPNIAAVKKALVLAKALNMKQVDYLVRFDRKNYFYQDLPKGYQITQQYYPIAQNGFLDIEVDNKKVQILIERFHIEEDTAKQFITEQGLLLDYNRSGCPLIEIVTKPVFHSAKAVKQYLVALRRILIHNDISEAKMEEGSMRADVNVSIRPFGAEKLGTRVEIKNINSINNVEKAINYEILRQTEKLLSGQKVTQSTRRYDDQTEKTVFMRNKTDEVEYRYMTEPNIIQIPIDKEIIEEVNQNLPEQPESIKNRLLNWELDASQIELLLDNKNILNAFFYIHKKTNNAKETTRWLLSELLGIVNKTNLGFNKAVSQIDLDNIVTLIMLLNDQTINGKQAKKILEESYKSKKNPKVLMVELKMQQIKDPLILKPILEKIIEQNKAKIIKDLETRADRIENMILGILMKETNGQANPEITTTLLRELLKNVK